MSTPQGPRDPAEANDGLKTARAVAKRVDRLEVDVQAVGRKVASLSKGMTVLLQQQRQQQPAGQPDWLRCHDVAKAKAILAGITAWLEEVGSGLEVKPPACWPWHPRAVVLLLAAMQHYNAAYSGDSAVAVSEFLTRYLTMFIKQVAGAIGDECNGAKHRLGEVHYGYDLDRLDDYAIWWATSREGLPPGLIPLMAAVG